MPRAPFRPRDVVAFIQAVESATGRAASKVEIGIDGRILVELTPPAGSRPAPATDENPWDEVFEDGDKTPT
jgi:hypothetical protein